jgi:hypothetical protein
MPVLLLLCLRSYCRGAQRCAPERSPESSDSPDAATNLSSPRGEPMTQLRLCPRQCRASGGRGGGTKAAHEGGAAAAARNASRTMVVRRRVRVITAAAQIRTTHVDGGVSGFAGFTSCRECQRKSSQLAFCTTKSRRLPLRYRTQTKGGLARQPLGHPLREHAAMRRWLI